MTPISDIAVREDRAEAASLELIHLLHRAGQGGDELFLSRFREYGLTPRQFAVLAAAAHNQDQSQAALVAETGIDRSTLADIVGRLVEKGLLERNRTQHDARAYAIRVTDQGAQTIAELEPRLAQVERQILSVLPDAVRASFLEHLKNLVRNLSDLQKG